MPPRRKSYDAIVIGAGHNGLTAAAYLSGAGFSTLVVERREIVGGCCVTEEIAPGCRASTTSYVASMLRPTIIRDLELGAHGLKMVACDPGLLVPFPDGHVVPWWADRDRAIAEFRKLSPRDAETFVHMDDRLKKLARYLQPFFLEPPPDPTLRGAGGWFEMLRVGKRFRGMRGEEAAQLVSFLTGSLGDFLDRHYESEKMKTMFLANNVYGKHGGPYDAGSALGLLFHLLSGGDGEIQGFYGHVIGGMGAITQALASACRKLGAEILTSAPVAKVDVRDGRARGVLLEDGTEISARIVLSNADPKRTFLGLVEARELPADFRRAVAGIKMDGPMRQSEFRAERRTARDRHAARMAGVAARAFHAGAVTGIRRALLRHREVRRNSRRAVGGLRRRVECGFHAGAGREARDDDVHPVRAVQAAAGNLG